MSLSDRPITAVVVGGGPGGLMAAEELAAAGARVSVYEHMPSVGRKLTLAGKGGLNLTHSEHAEEFISRFGNRANELAGALDAFSANDLREWCAGLGEPTFVGTSGRVFPESFTSAALLRAWLVRLGDLGVVIHTEHEFLGWDSTDPGQLRFSSPDGAVVVRSDVAVFALGGASWPQVGSTGSWVEPFREAGITVKPLQAANCGVVTPWSKVFAEKFAGTPVKNVALRVAGQAGSIVSRGDAMVSETGLEGGPVYALGAEISAGLAAPNPVTLELDLFPDLDARKLLARLTKGSRPRDSASTWLRRAGFKPVGVALLREATANSIPRDANILADLAKAVPVPVESRMPIERAISSSGGVDFEELNDELMLQSMPGTFVAGEMLDWEAPTGGYLLQGTFSTAVLAARGALRWAQSNRPAV